MYLNNTRKWKINQHKKNTPLIEVSGVYKGVIKTVIKLYHLDKNKSTTKNPSVQKGETKELMGWDWVYVYYRKLKIKSTPKKKPLMASAYTGSTAWSRLSPQGDLTTLYSMSTIPQKHNFFYRSSSSADDLA